ncbi:cytochrome P450 [Hypoxylon sp. NC1633]|nr:cytochrome P450 [Hypoxylon sp. NC1633]
MCLQYSPPVTSIAHDTRHDERSESSPAASYKNLLQMILENCVLIMALVAQSLAKPWLPKSLRRLHEACLTENEMYGKTFALNFAGHDTTTHTFTFATHFLAGVACLSCLEKVHLYTPVPVAKWTGTQAQSLNVGTKTIVLPPDTTVIPRYSSVQTDPKRTDTSTSPGEEGLVTPPHGSYLGEEFSQVEFVGTMAALSRSWRFDSVSREGEIIEDARGRVLLLQTRTRRAPLVWNR